MATPKSSAAPGAAPSVRGSAAAPREWPRLKAEQLLSCGEISEEEYAQILRADALFREEDRRDRGRDRDRDRDGDKQRGRARTVASPAESAAGGTAGGGGTGGTAAGAGVVVQEGEQGADVGRRKSEGDVLHADAAADGYVDVGAEMRDTEGDGEDGEQFVMRLAISEEEAAAHRGSAGQGRTTQSGHLLVPVAVGADVTDGGSGRTGAASGTPQQPLTPERKRAQRAAARAQEKQEKLREKKRQQRAAEVAAHTRAWRTEILPVWSESVATSRTVRQLCWKGIPPSVRCEAWQAMIGNPLQITPQLYKIVSTKAKKLLALSTQSSQALQAAYAEATFAQAAEEAVEATASRSSMPLRASMQRLSRDDDDHDANDVAAGTFAAGKAGTDDGEEEEDGAADDDGDDDDDDDEDDEDDGDDHAAADDDDDDDDDADANAAADVDAEVRPADGVSGSEEEGTATAEVQSITASASVVSQHRVAFAEETTAADLTSDGNDEEGEDGEYSKESTIRLIETDLPRTFPSLAFFHDGGPMERALREVLEAYVLYRPDVGYVQGMSYLAAMLLLNVDNPFLAFSCLANVLREHFFDFYRLNPDEIQCHIDVFDHFFKTNLPLLHQHFDEEGVRSDMFLIDWSLTLFCRTLPLDVASRVWDCYLCQGQIFYIKTAIGILRLFAAQLSEKSMGDILRFLNRLPEDLDGDDLFRSIHDVRIHPNKFSAQLDAAKRRLAAVRQAAASPEDTTSIQSGRTIATRSASTDSGSCTLS